MLAIGIARRKLRGRAATDYATHQARSYRTAFNLLERINRGFQEAFPVAA